MTCLPQHLAAAHEDALYAAAHGHTVDEYPSDCPVCAEVHARALRFTEMLRTSAGMLVCDAREAA